MGCPTQPRYKSIQEYGEPVEAKVQGPRLLVPWNTSTVVCTGPKGPCRLFDSYRVSCLLFEGSVDKLTSWSQRLLNGVLLYFGWVESVQPRCLSQTIQEVKDIFATKEAQFPNQLIVMESCLASRLLPLASTLGKWNQARNPNRCFGCFELTRPLRPIIAWGKTKTATCFATWDGLSAQKPWDCVRSTMVELAIHMGAWALASALGRYFNCCMPSWGHMIEFKNCFKLELRSNLWSSRSMFQIHRHLGRWAGCSRDAWPILLAEFAFSKCFKLHGLWIYKTQ